MPRQNKKKQAESQEAPFSFSGLVAGSGRQNTKKRNTSDNLDGHDLFPKPKSPFNELGTGLFMEARSSALETTSPESYGRPNFRWCFAFWNFASWAFARS